MNQQLARIIRRSLCGAIAVLVTLFAPTPYVFAESAGTSAPSSCSPAASAPSGITRPTGSDAKTYTYNSCTGLWENAYYTWNPATQKATPKYVPVFRCDTQTWKWVSSKWTYDPGAGSFIQIPVSDAALPTGAAVAADSVVPCAPPVQQSPAQTPLAETTDQPSTLTDPTLAANTDNSANLTNTDTATLDDAVDSQATSGNAAVLNNTTGGNATSGDAMAQATVINGVQTSSALTNPNLVKFVANINGDVQGDLVIDPSMLQPASSGETLDTNNNITVNNQNAGTINNDIDLASQTGDATVRGNTTGGDATTGDATTIADVVNMLNSLVSAGKSFMGVVNINGNLNGNILLPQDLVQNLIASNAPSTTVDLSTAQADSLGITNTTNQAITNNLTTSATSGAAAVTDNTTAGSATTGNAATKVTIFNLTGNQVVGANCLLVFVNVSGQWVGMIMNAPGATAAALGSGLTENTENNVTLTNSTNDAITNNITAQAASGDAKVADNTTGGNARSGNANTAVNLLNMDTSDFDLTGWFGILFINVFGNWYGNLGAFTPQTTNQTTNNPPASSNNPRPTTVRKQPFTFVAQAASLPEATGQTTDTPLPQVGAALVATTSKVLAASTDVARTSQPVSPESAQHTAQVVGLVLVSSGAALLLAERLVAQRRGKASA